MIRRINCHVCREKKPTTGAEEISTAGGCGRAWRCEECSTRKWRDQIDAAREAS